MQSRLEQAVKLGQRQFFCWLGSDLLAVNSDLICLRIYGKHRRAVVPYDILLADTAAAVYRDNRFFQSVCVFDTGIESSLGNEGQACLLFAFP